MTKKELIENAIIPVQKLSLVVNHKINNKTRREEEKINHAFPNFSVSISI
jgi:hypothetical protein